MLKKFNKRNIITALFVSAAYTGFAQTDSRIEPFSPAASYRTWSLGVHAGILNQGNVMGFRRDFNSVETQLGYGLYVNKQITPSFGLQAEYLGGKVNGSTDYNNDNFSTSLPWSAAITANVTLANISWRYINGVVKPYFKVGAGALNFETTLEQAGNTSTHASTTKAFIPTGAGLKFAVASGINLDLGYTLNLVNSNTFDGVDRGRKDIFSYAHIGVEFALGDVSKPFLANRNPVADMKRDYEASYDELAAALRAQKEENAALKAQLDTDLADDDGDGVANKFDKCPNTPSGTQVDGSGCPLPEVKAPVIQQITVTEEDKRVVDEAIKNLEFDLGKATIRPTSLPSLDRVAELLVNKNFSLKLAGHTDNTGSQELNMRLSKERAESVKAYLVSKGANPSRIEATGYGPNQPIASNATAEGRQINRRVEFTLY